MKNGAIVLGLIALNHVMAIEYHISINGSDSNPGTASAPWKTLAKAGNQAQPGDICILHAGIYRETLKPLHSGTSAMPIVFKAAAGESVLLSGADPVLSWSIHTGNILKANMAWDLGQGLNQVFSNNKMLFEARYPNPGQNPDPIRPLLAKVSLNGTTLTSSEFSQTTNAWIGATFHGWIGESWTAQGAQVIGSSLGQVELGGTLTAPWFQGVGKGYLTGVMSALDSPGEWFYQSGILYLIPPMGSDISSLNIEAKRRGWAIDLDRLEHIQVLGINVFSASVRMTGNNCKVENMGGKYISHFTHTGSGYDKTQKADLGRNGIWLAGTANILSVCDLEYSAGTGIILAGTGNRVSDCSVHAMDYQGLYSSPVIFEGSKNILEWSTIYDAGRDLIHFTGTGHKIVHNEIYNPGLLTLDLGALYTNGNDAQGTIVAYNWVHDNQNHKGVSPCIYLDNKSKNVIVHHNVVWNCEGDAGIRINGPAEGHQIFNNTLFNADDVGTHTYTSEPGLYQYSKANNLLVVDFKKELQDAMGKDFRLSLGSSAIDRGQIIAGFTDGFLGTSPDLGAYEHGGEAWKAGVRTKPGNPAPTLMPKHKAVAKNWFLIGSTLHILDPNIQLSDISLHLGNGLPIPLDRMDHRTFLPIQPLTRNIYFLRIKDQTFVIPYL